MSIDKNRELAGIAEVLVPYTEFNAAELATQLHNVVERNVPDLLSRNLGGVVVRYGGDFETAEAKVRKGQREQAQLGHYAIVNTFGDVVGGASIYPGLPLRRLKAPLPPVLARGPLVTEYPFATPNIHAWVDQASQDTLPLAYKDLIFLSMGWWKRPDAKKPWTVEPAASPQHIHEAIIEGSLEKVTDGYFDEGESRVQVPPKGILYASLYSNWETSRGKLNELKTNKKSWATKMDEGTDEIMSRNPKGG